MEGVTKKPGSYFLTLIYKIPWKKDFTLDGTFDEPR